MSGKISEEKETDRALKVLSHDCRRRLLFKLHEEVNSGKGESINYIGIIPHKTEREDLILYHNHLPKLDQCGYITWNKTEKTIQKGPQWAEIEPFLKLIYSHLQKESSDSNGKK